MSDPDGERFCEGNGPVFGYKPSSYRAEGYGILAVLRLIIRVFQFTNIDLPHEVHLYTDSQSMIKSIASYREQLPPFPNKTLEAEWDILQCISHCMDEFPVEPHLHYVRAHQNKDKSYDSLSLEGQLNEDADRRAAQYQHEPDRQSDVVPRLEGNSAQLYIDNATVTHDYKTVIRQAATAPALQDHIMRKEDWSQETFDTIDWEAIK